MDEIEEFELDLSVLSKSELREFGVRLKEEYNELKGTVEFSTEDEAEAHKEELSALREAILTVADEMKSRAEAERAAAEDENAFSVIDEFGEEDGDDEDDADVEVDEEAAAEVVISPKNVAGDSPAKKVEPVVASAPNFGVKIAGDVRGFRAGQEAKDWSEVAAAFIAKHPDLRASDASSGARHLVASVEAEYPEDRILTNDLDLTMARIKGVTSVEAITASGGFCAPLTPYYALQVWGDVCRPVRDALPVFKADRGGIRYVTSPRLSRLAGSTRKTTAAQDAAGYTNQDPAGTTAPKPCLHVVCEGEQTCIINAFSRCLTFGNLGARTYPEQVEAWLKLAGVEFSRYNEIELLDRIAAGSTAVTAAQVYGATFSVLEQISKVITSFRSRYRLCSAQTLRVMFPWWIKEILRSDLAAQGPGDGISRFAISDAQIEDWFRVRGAVVSYYQDNTTGAGAPFADPTAAPLAAWPSSVEWFVWPEGHWVYLDGGTLDLGLVRDSTLNSQNDYQIWMEEFSGVCAVGGGESLKITSTLVPNGSTAPAAAALRS